MDNPKSRKSECRGKQICLPLWVWRTDLCMDGRVAFVKSFTAVQSLKRLFYVDVWTLRKNYMIGRLSHVIIGKNFRDEVLKILAVQLITSAVKNVSQLKPLIGLMVVLANQ